MRLDRFNNSGFDRGKPLWVEATWRFVSAVLVESWVPGSGWRVRLLSLFGARLGKGMVIKPHVKIKFPWKLQTGDHCWIGEAVWIDNLAEVSMGNHCCISQGVYLCTGNHAWDRPAFDLVVKPIRLGTACWLGAHSRVGPGVRCGDGAVLTLGSVASADLPAWTVNTGNPAQQVRQRPDTTAQRSAVR